MISLYGEMVKNSTDCQLDSITNIADTATQVTKRILISCIPYDTHTITVIQKSIESGNIIGTNTGKALFLHF
jgi:ribosome recycling factor